jgi:hypothetical protein
LRNSTASGGVANYDVSPDGKRFVMEEDSRPVNGPAVGPVRLLMIVNWFDDLKARTTTK